MMGRRAFTRRAVAHVERNRTGHWKGPRSREGSTEVEDTRADGEDSESCKLILKREPTRRHEIQLPS